MIKLVFWASVVLILYHHVGYPLVVRAIAAWIGRKSHEPVSEPAVPPSVTIIVPAHNEEAVIAAKIRNLAALEYPRDRLTVVLPLDGCTDGTAAIARGLLGEIGSLDLRIVEYPSNIGKIAVLNDQIGRAHSDIVALSDTSSLLDPQALSQAVRHFKRPSVGVVCPTYALIRPGSEGERAYWNYQTRVKAAEGAVGAPMGAHGAFYLFRRNLWEPLEPDTINDDFVLPMRIVRRGYDAVYDIGIVATELETSTARQDFRRRIRIGAGNLQQVLRLPDLADPRRPGLAFTFLSGKALRAFMPFLLLIAAVSLPVLAVREGGFYLYALTGEVLVGLAALVGHLGVPGMIPRPVRWAAYFVQGHAAGFIGALILLGGLQGHAWKLSAAAKAKA
ncbi:glycosyltransferase family 2 protein [Microvirga sp. KLBC 81]|uniref:glycosyltransferase family 2 protein n=1 Tax=Microvirga sp. KLBC 81 TaxID=1862707 RepID=UPI0014042002|nr:glycosyltransferase family 2 protein [Microvirga sp. KLBC 81]